MSEDMSLSVLRSLHFCEAKYKLIGKMQNLSVFQTYCDEKLSLEMSTKSVHESPSRNMPAVGLGKAHSRKGALRRRPRGVYA